MEDARDITEKLEEIRQSLDLLILLEFCKSGATRDQIREVLGSLDNNLYAKINKLFSKER